MSKKKENVDLQFRVITIGDSGVGKTAIMRKYIYNFLIKIHSLL